MKPLLSIIILSFNTKQLLEQCLSSVFASRGFRPDELEVIVVDNHSSDGSAATVIDQFPQTTLIHNPKNIGFSAGNNIGIQNAKGEHLLLLNSDAMVEPDTLHEMVKLLKRDNRIGAATCRLELPNGTIDPASHRGFPTPWNAFTYMSGLERLLPRFRWFSGYHRGWEDRSVTHDIDAISGAFFMTRQEVIKNVGMLDEHFFMYGEDIDWCYRIKEAGYRVVYHPAVAAFHHKKQSGRAHPDDMEVRKTTERYFLETMELFYRKHYHKKYPILLTWLVVFVIRIRKAFLI